MVDVKKWVTSLVLYPDSNNVLNKIHSDIVRMACKMGYEPLYIFSYSKKFVETVKERGAHYTIGIIDSEYIRYPKTHRSEFEEIGKELLLFKEAEALLVHGQNMKMYLRGEGVSHPMIHRGPFDYLSSLTEVKLTNNLQRKICFVGNPKKSDFLQNWNYKTSIMGFFPKEVQNFVTHNVEIMGHKNFFERIPRDRFGIFWESGLNYQEYSKYTMPHKCSLYLALGMPIIAWKESNIATLIEKEGLGIIVESLDEIDQKLKSLSEQELIDMKKRVNKFSYRIRSGFYTKNALAQLEQGIFHNVWTA